MAVVNQLYVLHECRKCGDLTNRIVQYRYGLVWQLDYTIGAAIEWGEPSVGDPSDEGALVTGSILPCGVCGDRGLMDVLFVSGAIVGIAEPGTIDASLPITLATYSRAED